MRSFHCADAPVAGSIKVQVLRLETRPESATARRRELLKFKVKALFEANNGEYGYRRLHQALRLFHPALCLADLQYVNGLGELAGPPGA